MRQIFCYFFVVALCLCAGCEPYSEKIERLKKEQIEREKRAHQKTLDNRQELLEQTQKIDPPKIEELQED